MEPIEENQRINIQKFEHCPTCSLLYKSSKSDWEEHKRSAHQGAELFYRCTVTGSNQQQQQQQNQFYFSSTSDEFISQVMSHISKEHSLQGTPPTYEPIWKVPLKTFQAENINSSLSSKAETSSSSFSAVAPFHTIPPSNISISNSSASSSAQLSFDQLASFSSFNPSPENNQQIETEIDAEPEAETERETETGTVTEVEIGTQTVGETETGTETEVETRNETTQVSPPFIQTTEMSATLSHHDALRIIIFQTSPAYSNCNDWLKQFRCPLACNNTLYCKEMLRQHINAVHRKQKRFVCTAQGCDKKFQYSTTAQTHALSKHKNDSTFVEVDPENSESPPFSSA